MTFEKPSATFAGLRARGSALDLPASFTVILATVLIAVGTTLQR